MIAFHYMEEVQVTCCVNKAKAVQQSQSLYQIKCDNAIQKESSLLLFSNPFNKSVVTQITPIKEINLPPNEELWHAPISSTTQRQIQNYQIISGHLVFKSSEINY